MTLKGTENGRAPYIGDMTDEDRFGLKGAPEIQAARRIQLGRGPIREGWLGGGLLLGLAAYAAVNLLHAQRPRSPGWAAGWRRCAR